MFKEDNEWDIECDIDYDRKSNIKINGNNYVQVNDDMAAVIHSILLLVDAVNDKKMFDN